MTKKELTPRQAKYLRRFLYAIVLLSVLVLCLPMLISAITSVEEGTVIDPFTGVLVSREERSEEVCLIRGGVLLKALREKRMSKARYVKSLGELESCKEEAPEIYTILHEQVKLSE